MSLWSSSVLAHVRCNNVLRGCPIRVRCTRFLSFFETSGASVSDAGCVKSNNILKRTQISLQCATTFNATGLCLPEAMTLYSFFCCPRQCICPTSLRFMSLLSGTVVQVLVHAGMISSFQWQSAAPDPHRLVACQACRWMTLFIIDSFIR